MLTGPKEERIKPLVYPRALRDKQKGFTLVEALVSVFILTVVIGALLLTLTRGEFSNSVSSAKADLQAKVRRITDWIVRDVRQSNLIEINTNSPSQDHIKFRTVTGIDGTGQYTLSTTYIEYDYNSVSDELTRNEVDAVGSVLNSWVFDNITQSPFYVDYPSNPLDPGDILTSKELVVAISGESQVNSSLTLNCSLTEEVKIRNE